MVWVDKMKKRIIIIAVLAFLLLPSVALAATITASRWYGVITVSNNETARTNVATTTNISTENFITLGYLNASANNCAMRSSSGADVAFQPGFTSANLWSFFVPAIGDNSYLTYILYTAECTGGILNYFPAAGGMTTTDNETMELGDNFTVEQSGWVDTSAGANKTLVYKQGAFVTRLGGQSIRSEILYAGAFPTVAAVTGGNNAGNSVNHTVNLTAGISPLDLILVFFGADEDPVITFPSGWTELFQDSQGALITFGAWYRIADGTEGATILVTTSNAQRTAHTSYRITGYSGVPEVGVTQALITNKPDPPNLAPSWGAVNTLWFASTAHNDGGETITVYPTNYTNGREDIAAAGQGCGVGTARRERNIANENPGTFTLSAAEGWVANTIAIAPVISVTATGVSSGNITVTTTANITHLRISIDGVPQDTVVLTANVTNNSEAWTFVENGSMIYLEYQEFTINETQAQFIEWEYDSIFTDQSVNDNDATPTFRGASSDLNVSANMTAFLPVAEAKAPDYVIGRGAPFFTATPNITGTFTTTPPVGTFPLSVAIQAVANATGMPPQLPLLTIAVFATLAASLTMSALMRRHGSGTLIGKILVIVSFLGVFIALGNFGIDFWVLIVFVIIATALAFGSRQGSWA